MENCIFCKIVSGKIQTEKVWESKDSVAFLDVNPFTKGHLLVIPKEHVRWIWDMKEKDYSNFLLDVKKVAGILKKAYNTDCVQQLIIGMEVPHVHVHLLPRIKDDGFSEFPKKPLDPKPSDLEMREIAEKIRKNAD